MSITFGSFIATSKMLLVLLLILPIYGDLVVDNSLPQVGNQKQTRETNGKYVVETSHGRVRGSVMKDADIVQYLDIPYGRFDADKPFQEPIEPKSWENILYKEFHTSRCPQLKSDGSFIGTKDCLTLSIFTPKEPQNANILFHIYDGNFNMGSADPEIYGPHYLVPKGIILVLPNYRVGALGFMCLNNETAPGNAGLKDLALALKWTKDNIEAFGGNSSNIIVSGSGTSAALVDYLMIANDTRQHVAKVITESGFALSHWAINRNPSIDVTVPTGTDLETIVKALENEIFRPCIENEGGLVTASFWNLIHQNKINIPVMMGSANQAGKHTLLSVDDEYLAKLNTDISRILPNDLLLNAQARTQIGDRVKKQYFGNNNITKDDIEKLSLCITDIGFLSPGVRQARALSSAGAEVYFYEFSYSADRENFISGAAKGDSLYYIFSKEVSSSARSEVDNKIKNIMLDFWVHFITKGVPTTEGVEWNSFGSRKGNEECLQIDSEMKLLDHLHAERLQLWDEIYDKHYIEISQAAPIKQASILVLTNALIALKLLSSTN